MNTAPQGQKRLRGRQTGRDKDGVIETEGQRPSKREREMTEREARSERNIKRHRETQTMRHRERQTMRHRERCRERHRETDRKTDIARQKLKNTE